MPFRDYISTTKLKSEVRTLTLLCHPSSARCNLKHCQIAPQAGHSLWSRFLTGGHGLHGCIARPMPLGMVPHVLGNLSFTDVPKASP